MKLIVSIAVVTLAALGLFIIVQKIRRPKDKSLEDFKRWGVGILVLFSAGFLIALLPWEEILDERTLAITERYRWISEIYIPILLAVGVTFVSIYYSCGTWYQVYRLFEEDLGIKGARPSREGRRTDRDRYWLDLIGQARRSVVLSGATLGGWFSGNFWADLKQELPKILQTVQTFDVFVPDPNDSGFKTRAADEAYTRVAYDATERVGTAFGELSKLFDEPLFSQHIRSNKLNIYLYTGTPISATCVDDEVHCVTYLPKIPDAECPVIVARRSGRFAAQIVESLAQLRARPRRLRRRTNSQPCYSRSGGGVTVEKHRNSKR